MSVYIKREINADLQIAVGLSQLWDLMYIRVNELRMLSSELNMFGGPLGVQCAKFFKQLSQTEVLRMLELRKTIAKVAHANSRLDSRKSTMDNFIGSAEEVDHVIILQSCNGLLLCAVYWKDASYWLETENRQLKHYKLNIEDHDHPIITTIEIPHGLHRGRNFLASFGGLGPCFLVCNMILALKSYYLRMIKGCSVWSVRYLVNTEKLMNLLPKGWLIQSTIWSIGLGEREDDVFLVINLSEHVVKYNLISKTINEIFDIGSNQMNDDDDDDDDDEFVRPFLVDPNVYEFIPSFAIV
ncbi:hypothetical protein Tco_0956100 [Tanacetum coccineum]|uniref:Uncharacterized protein n=1 Tax=Tanacetum coccineum TaxID=301880 RepID=A0ABQ5E914_9ASTR